LFAEKFAKEATNWRLFLFLLLRSLRNSETCLGLWERCIHHHWSTEKLLLLGLHRWN